MGVVAVKLRIPALGDFELVAELEVPDQLVTSTAPSTISEMDLASRWGCSTRSLRRLRDQRKLGYCQPTARSVVYRLSEIEAYEREHEVPAGDLRPLRRRVQK